METRRIASDCYSTAVLRTLLRRHRSLSRIPRYHLCEPLSESLVLYLGGMRQHFGEHSRRNEWGCSGGRHSLACRRRWDFAHAEDDVGDEVGSRFLMQLCEHGGLEKGELLQPH